MKFVDFKVNGEQRKARQSKQESIQPVFVRLQIQYDFMKSGLTDAMWNGQISLQLRTKLLK